MASPIGRFAPTPSGRMHLGNVFAALVAWLSVRSQGGAMVLRMEDLDTQRTSAEFSALLRQDLTWLGLDWDLETPPQSQRAAAYDRYFSILQEKGLLYPCYCTRSQLHSVNAPHLSDGTYVYPGTCRNLQVHPDRAPAWRVTVPDRTWAIYDLVQGPYTQNLATDCGDMVVRRADGVYVYQLAVTVDDGEAGVTEVVRGMDLLSSVPRQMYLQELFGFPHPQYAHVPPAAGPGRPAAEQAGPGSGSGSPAAENDFCTAYRCPCLHRRPAGKAGAHLRPGACGRIFLGKAEKGQYFPG